MAFCKPWNTSAFQRRLNPSGGPWTNAGGASLEVATTWDIRSRFTVIPLGGYLDCTGDMTFQAKFETEPWKLANVSGGNPIKFATAGTWYEQTWEATRIGTYILRTEILYAGDGSSSTVWTYHSPQMTFLVKAPSGLTVYETVINSVLSTLGEDEMTTDMILSAKGIQRQVKRIICEVMSDISRGLPDNFWQTTGAVRLRAPLTTGKVSAVSDDVVTFTGVDFTLPPASNYDVSGGSCWIKIDGEDQWYEVVSSPAADQLQLGTNHVTYSPSAGGAPFAGEVSYQMVQIRYALPSDLADIREVHGMSDSDLHPASACAIMDMMGRSGFDVRGSRARYYGIAWGNGATVPMLYVWRPVEEDTVIDLVYRRTPICIDPDALDALDTVDLPVDRIAELRHRSKVEALSLFRRSPDLLGTHARMYLEQRDSSRQSTLSRSERGVVRPRVHRSFYRTRGSDLRGG